MGLMTLVLTLDFEELEVQEDLLQVLEEPLTVLKNLKHSRPLTVSTNFVFSTRSLTSLTRS